MLGWKASGKTEKEHCIAFIFQHVFMRKADLFMLGNKLKSTSTPTMLSLLSLAILNAIITVKQATVDI